MPDGDALAEHFRKADRRLRGLLLGDGMFVPGIVRGEEARAQVTRELRWMRDAFDAAVVVDTARAEKAEARVADLEQELKSIASSTAKSASRRRARGTSRKRAA